MVGDSTSSAPGSHRMQPSRRAKSRGRRRCHGCASRRAWDLFRSTLHSDPLASCVGGRTAGQVSGRRRERWEIRARNDTQSKKDRWPPLAAMRSSSRTKPGSGSPRPSRGRAARVSGRTMSAPGSRWRRLAGSARAPLRAERRRLLGRGSGRAAAATSENRLVATGERAGIPSWVRVPLPPSALIEGRVHTV